MLKDYSLLSCSLHIQPFSPVLGHLSSLTCPASSRLPAPSTRAIAGGLDQGCPVLFLCFLSGGFLAALQNSAETPPILRRCYPTTQEELCCPPCWPAHTPPDAHPHLLEPHMTLTPSLKQPPPPWPDLCLRPSNILTTKDHGVSVPAGVWVSEQAGPSTSASSS